jgi:sialidase-1
MVELRNGSLLANARSLANPGGRAQRIQALSADGGASFGATRFVPELPQPVDGCEGSMVAAPGGRLFFSGPDSKLLRDRFAVWESDDEGATWGTIQGTVDPGAAGYSSLQHLGAVPVRGRGAEEAGGRTVLALLYEQSDADQIVMNPDRFVFRLFDV